MSLSSEMSLSSGCGTSFRTVGSVDRAPVNLASVAERAAGVGEHRLMEVADVLLYSAVLLEQILVGGVGNFIGSSTLENEHI